MASFKPIPVPRSLERPKSPLYFSSCYHYAIKAIRDGGKNGALPFLTSERDCRDVSGALHKTSTASEMLDDTSVFFALQYMVEASRVTPDKKTRPRTYDELKAYPDIFVCDSITIEQFSTAALSELSRDLDAGYEKLSPKLVESIHAGESLLFPIHHHPNITVQYEDADTSEPLSCASDTYHWTLVFAHCQSRGNYSIYHYDSLPCRSNLMYAFKSTYAILDSVIRKKDGSPATVSSVHCSFSDRPKWPFAHIVPQGSVRSIENMIPQESLTSCGLFVLGYGLLLAVMRSPLKKSAVEQITETFVKPLGVFMARIFVAFYVANTERE